MTRSENSTENAAQRRRYRWLLMTETVLLALTIGMCFSIPHAARSWAEWPLRLLLPVLGLWHVVVVPICFFYLCGNPIVMTLSTSTAEGRAFWKQLRERPALSDDEFYARYYQGSAISKEIPVRVRRALQTLLPMIDRAIPTDLLWFFEEEIHFIWVLECIEEEFGVHFTKADYASIDGTLGNLILLVHVRVSPQFG